MRKGGKVMGEEVRYATCLGCGEIFTTTKITQNYCSDACKIKGRYQSRFDVKKEATRHENMRDIKYIAKLAREEGLSYGQYVSKHRLYGKDVYKRK